MNPGSVPPERPSAAGYYVAAAVYGAWLACLAALAVLQRLS
jgi:hypothetical protein